MRRFSAPDLMLKNRGVLGVHMGTFEDQALLKRHLRSILTEVEGGALAPVVSRAFPLEQAVEAHRHIHERANFGKVLLHLA